MSRIEVITISRSANFISHARAPLELRLPFAAGVNPLAAEAQAASLDWALGLGLVAGDEQLRALGRQKLGWLPARAFHSAPREPLQLAADWTTLSCLLDDRVERLAASGGLIRISDELSRLLYAFAGREADRPFERGFGDLGRRLRALAAPGQVRQFAAALESLFSGRLWQAIHHARGLEPSVEAYCTMRELTIGLSPQFLLGELCEDAPLGELARAHPALSRLGAAASRCVGWASDLFTHEKKRERRDAHNLVLLLAGSVPLDEAVRRVVERHDAEVRAFLDAEARLPSFGAGDPPVRRYVGMLQAWMRGHLDWARDTARYRPTPPLADQSE